MHILQTRDMSKKYTLILQNRIKFNAKRTMKKINLTFSLFILGMFTIANLFGQNVMFLEFNKTYSEVVLELQALNVDEIEFETPARPLTAYYDGFTAAYYFNHNHRLYKVEVTKNYTQNHVMKDAVKGAVDYFEIVCDEVEHANDSKNKTQVIKAAQKERQFEMEITTFAKNDMEVTIIGIDNSHAPSQAYLNAHAAR